MANRPQWQAAATSLLLSVAVATPAAAGEFEHTLRARFQGVWGVLLTESYSDCAGTYSNNRFAGAGVRSSANHRFDPGELAKLDKLNLKRARVDLFVTVAEPILESFIDGPFELFDEKRCEIQLMIDLPRSVVKGRELETVVERISEVFEAHGDLSSAQGSESWNRRRRRELPEDYERTLALHARWKTEQMNISAGARTAEALEIAERIIDRLSDDPDYNKGLVAGMAEMRNLRIDECPELIDARFATHEARAPSDRRSSSPEDRRFQDGFSDGQELVFQVLIANRLRACIQPLPPHPGD